MSTDRFGHRCRRIACRTKGDAHDVRYAPTEFDGWRERHWTRPFRGERFSLVWFTPAEDLDNGDDGGADDDDGGADGGEGGDRESVG